MITQYPHTLKYTIVSGAAQDGSGNWTSGTPTEVSTSCRFEPETKTVFVEAADGKQVQITGNIYLPLPAITIQPGTNIEVLNGATVISRGKAQRHSAGQLNQRLWL